MARSRTVAPSKSRSLLNCQRLESRLTPAFAYTGPLLVEQMREIQRLGLNAYETQAALPASATGAISYLQLASFTSFAVDVPLLEARLAEAPATREAGGFELAIPRPDGSYGLFAIWEASILDPALAAEHPELRTFRGQGVDDPTATLAADMTPQGFHAQVLTPRGDYYIDPYYHLDTSAYVAYFSRDNLKSIPVEDGAAAEVKSESPAAFAPTAYNPSADPPAQGSGGGIAVLGPTTAINYGSTLRTLRAAIGTTYEYTTFQGGASGALAAVVTSVNRISGVFEKESSIRLQLVATESAIISTTSNDPYTSGDVNAMLAQNQTTLDNLIGTENYDIGHVVDKSGTSKSTDNGVAGAIGNVGITGQKAQGATTSFSPVGDSFDIDYTIHEMGHQFGAYHTFNASGESTAAYEPGSGSTIMSYAGIVSGNNVQAHSDAYFHADSLSRINNWITNTIPNVGTKTSTGNQIPTANAGADYTIPANTPFALTGSGSDPDGDAITYTWEEFDQGPKTTLGTYSSTAPLFRSVQGTTDPTRTIPTLANLLSNTASVNEVIPTGARTLNFTLTVRDNRAGGGAARSDDTVLTVAASAGFAVTSPNTAVSWTGGSAQTVTWNVSGTNAAPINTSLVNILLSTDGGQTFPTTIASSVANSGSATVTIPNSPTTNARIKVQPLGNIYFDISNVAFTIVDSGLMGVTGTTPSAGGLLSVPTATLDVTFAQPINPATLSPGDLTVSAGTVTAAAVVNGSTARFTISSLSGEGAVAASIAAGAVVSTTGNGSSQYSGSFTRDIGTIAFPGTFVAVAPVGSRAYSSNAVSGYSINAFGDQDSFTLTLEAGQTLSAIVVPGSSLTPKITVTGAGTSSSAFSVIAGQPISLSNVAIATAGTYTVVVEGNSSTAGSYTLQLLLNSAAEAEGNGGSTNNTPATAQNLTAALVDLGGVRLGSVLGKFDGSSSAVEAEPNDTTATATSAAATFSAVTSTVYELALSASLSSTSDVDYFKIGAMQAGDVLTISLRGAKSNGGTHADPKVFLLNSSGSTLTSDDDGGVHTGSGGSASGDSLIYRYAFTSGTATANAIVEVYRYGTPAGSGTYTLGITLENSGTAPATTASTAALAETESNNTSATANDFSTSWKLVSHSSAATGSLSTSSDIDTFAYSFTAGDVIGINARSTSTLDAKVRILNSSGTVLALENGTSTSPALNSPIYSFYIPTTGIYTIDVQAANATSGSYSLDVLLSTATAPPSPIDEYAIALAENQSLDVALMAASTGTYALDLLDANGNFVAASAGTATNADLAISAFSTAGNYILRVSGSTSANYLLTAAIGATLDLEPNDTSIAAQPLGANLRAVGALTGTDDWFSISVAAGNTLTLSTSTPGDATGLFDNSLNPALALTDNSGTPLIADGNSAADGRNATLSYPITATGTYRIKLSAENSTSGEYTLTASTAVTPPTTPVPSGFTVNDGGVQQSRITSITLNFASPIDVSAYTAVPIALTRYKLGSTSTPGANVPLSNSAATGDGLIAVTQAGTNALLLTFSVAGEAVPGLETNDTVDSGSLGDGYWRLRVGSGGSLLDSGGDVATPNPALRRLFGDFDASGSVDPSDVIPFGGAFGTSLGGSGFDAAFDFDNSFSIDPSDVIPFGGRFGVSL